MSVVQASEPGVVRLASYNIRLKIGGDDLAGNGWDARKQAVIALVRFHQFAVVGMQEVLHTQFEDLKALDEYTAFGVGRDDGKEAGEYAPIFFLTERFEKLDGGTFWYSETPDRPSFGWDAQKYRRICTWVKLRERTTRSEFVVFNSHFDHEAVIARRESAKLLLKTIAERAGEGIRAFAIGDFNSTPDSEPYRILAERLIDTRGASETPAYGPKGTFNAFKFGPDPSELIDHIFMTPRLRVLRHGTLNDAINGRYPSDHFPIFADVALTR